MVECDIAAQAGDLRRGRGQDKGCAPAAITKGINQVVVHEILQSKGDSFGSIYYLQLAS